MLSLFKHIFKIKTPLLDRIQNLIVFFCSKLFHFKTTSQAVIPATEQLKHPCNCPQTKEKIYKTKFIKHGLSELQTLQILNPCFINFVLQIFSFLTSQLASFLCIFTQEDGDILQLGFTHIMCFISIEKYQLSLKKICSSYNSNKTSHACKPKKLKETITFIQIATRNQTSIRISICFITVVSICSFCFNEFVFEILILSV